MAWNGTDLNCPPAGVFDLHVSVDWLFFIGSQLVALSHTGKVGVWHSMTQHWQVRDSAALFMAQF